MDKFNIFFFFFTFAENQCLHHIFVNYEFGIVASRCLVLSVEPTLESSTDCCLGC